jgi:hypothetical protein
MDLYSEVADVPIDDVEAAVEKVEEGDGTPAAGSASAVDERITRRAKRPSKYLVKHLSKEGSSSPNAGQNGGAEGTSLIVNGIRTAKNLRRPRNGYGRGLPKKGKSFQFISFGFIGSIIVLFSFCFLLAKSTCFPPFLFLFDLSFSLPLVYLPKDGGLEKRGEESRGYYIKEKMRP